MQLSSREKQFDLDWTTNDNDDDDDEIERYAHQRCTFIALIGASQNDFVCTLVSKSEIGVMVGF